jgi:hypothetical protein
MAGEINPVGVVDDAIEDGIGIAGIADQFVPFVDGNLAGDDRRSAVVPENSIRWDSRGETESAHHPMRWLRLSTCLRRL